MTCLVPLVTETNVLVLPLAPEPEATPGVRLILCDAGRPVVRMYDGGHVAIPAGVTLQEAARVWARCFKTPQKRSKR